MRLFRALICCIIFLCSCSDSSRNIAVPRPTAFPRVAELGNEYMESDSLALRFTTNADADLRIKSPEWFDIVYPQYGAVVYVSITPVNKNNIGEVLDNRRQRIAINISDLSSMKTTEISSANFKSELYESSTTRSTPLQFISTNGDEFVVSGTVFFANAASDAPIDSLAPMVSRIKTDIVKALSEMSTWE